MTKDQLVHFYAGFPGKALCMGADTPLLTLSNTDKDRVTCNQCLALLAPKPAELPPSKDQLKARIQRFRDGLGAGGGVGIAGAANCELELAIGGPLLDAIEDAIDEIMGSAHEPKSDHCEVCTKPLPAVGAWSMPSCPDCQELLEGLGQLMGDFADREQTIKADWIGRAINLICARPSQPPPVDLATWAQALDIIGQLAEHSRCEDDEWVAEGHRFFDLHAPSLTKPGEQA